MKILEAFGMEFLKEIICECSINNHILNTIR
jgi:hypothetical protein